MSASKGPSSKVALTPATEIADPSTRTLAPIRINLLPHREMRRDRRKKDFVVLAALVAAAGVAAAFAGGFAINQQISAQQDRNNFIVAENAKLDKEIAEIKTLREEIAALRARQQAVENLQSDRTVPVRLFDELVRLSPEGMYLRQLRQDDQRVSLVGHAATNERVAELLRNLGERSPWLERPAVGATAAGKREERKVYEFSLNALIKKPAQPAAAPRPGAPRTEGAEPQKSAAVATPVKLGAAQ
ncbi:MAG TPA: PilN domain-containing protein [Burkholderiaceae bacterium]|nr:PilN domain-containing protein [Burkholderiaceae bacterium]